MTVSFDRSMPAGRVGLCAGAPHMSDVLLDRDADERAVLGPRSVVVLDVLLAEQLVQGEPGVARTLPDAAVRDGVLALVEAGFLVQGAQLVVGLERAVLVGRLAPRDVDGRRDVAAALRLLLRQVRRGEQLARELVRRADVDEVLGTDGVDDLVAERADRAVLVLGLVLRGRTRDGVGRQRTAV